MISMFPEKINIREIILFGTSLILAYFLFNRGCNNQKQVNNLVRDIVNYKDSIQFYKLKVNKNDVDIVFNQSLVLDNKKQLEALMAKNDTLMRLMSKFKNITGATIINQYTTINGDTIRLKGDSIPRDFKPFRVLRD